AEIAAGVLDPDDLVGIALGQFAHGFGQIVVLYNVPGRTVTDILPETVCELAKRYPDKVIGIKDASGDLSRVTDHRMGIGKHFCQMSGDDELALPANAAGAVGCISVTANVAPKLCAEFQAACAANDLEKARELNDKLYPLHYAMFEDASPGPVKYALSRVFEGVSDELRLPMVACNEAARAAVDAALEHAGLLGAA
ncbi:MAG: dihydrodipicolinate synthase family protein, partial [Novosphingobium sp.]